MKLKRVQWCLMLSIVVNSMSCALLSEITKDNSSQLHSKYENAWKNKNVNELIKVRYPDINTVSASGARLLVFNKFKLEASSKTTVGKVLDPNDVQKVRQTSPNFPAGLEKVNLGFHNKTLVNPPKGQYSFYCESYFEVNQTSNLVERIYWQGNDCDPAAL